MRAILAALIVCLFALPTYAQEPQHKIYLVLTYVTPGRNTPDIREKLPMESLDECWESAQEFVNRGVPDNLKSRVIATMAGCLVIKPEETDM